MSNSKGKSYPFQIKFDIFQKDFKSPIKNLKIEESDVNKFTPLMKRFQSATLLTSTTNFNNYEEKNKKNIEKISQKLSKRRSSLALFKLKNDDLEGEKKEKNDSKKHSRTQSLTIRGLKNSYLGVVKPILIKKLEENQNSAFRILSHKSHLTGSNFDFFKKTKNRNRRKKISKFETFRGKTLHENNNKNFTNEIWTRKTEEVKQRKEKKLKRVDKFTEQLKLRKREEAERRKKLAQEARKSLKMEDLEGEEEGVKIVKEIEGKVVEIVNDKLNYSPQTLRRISLKTKTMSLNMVQKVHKYASKYEELFTHLKSVKYDRKEMAKTLQNLIFNTVKSSYSYMFQKAFIHKGTLRSLEELSRSKLTEFFLNELNDFSNLKVKKICLEEMKKMVKSLKSFAFDFKVIYSKKCLEIAKDQYYSNRVKENSFIIMKSNSGSFISRKLPRLTDSFKVLMDVSKKNKLKRKFDFVKKVDIIEMKRKGQIFNLDGKVKKLVESLGKTVKGLEELEEIVGDPIV